jgi:GrpB-like predicted nucleotidyltransferase (UPF0157 family)
MSARTVLVVDYDPAWPLAFSALRAPIWEAVQDIAFSIEHVGSTSVPGLAAKPIIDMDVVMPSSAGMHIVIERLAVLGYVHRGNLGIEDREAFESPAGLPVHHLYACVRGSTALANHLAIRDCLRSDPARAAAYGALKKQLAEQFPGDAKKYVAGKTDFLLTVLRDAGFPHGVLAAIRNANRPG